MLQRLKNIIRLSKKQPEAIEALTKEQIDSLPNMGDGKAVFIDEGTEEEFKEQENLDKYGVKKLWQ
jgi:hypothetical protein